MLRESFKYSYIGIFFGIAICMGYFVGRWLDRRFHTAPYLGLVGLLLGIGAGFQELFRVAKQYRRDNQPDEPQKPAQKQ